MLLAPDLVDALDQPGADVAREVEVDVGQRAHLLVEEAPDQELVLDRVDVREPDQVADDRGNGGATATARRHVRAAARGVRPAHLRGHLPRQLEDLVVDEEEAGEVMLRDQLQLLREPPLRCLTVARLRAGVALAQPRAADHLQLLPRRPPRGEARRGQAVTEILRQVEAAAPRDAHGVRRRLRVVGREARRLLGR